MPKFSLPLDSSRSGENASRDLFHQSISSSKDRTHTYKRWSEKASILAFNEDTETYDIVITTITYTGTSSAVNKVNRTVRNVRSIIPTIVYTFKPGEIVLIGYISERRESPVIMGLKAAKTNKIINSSINIGNDTPLAQKCALQVLYRQAGEEDQDVTFEEALLAECSEFSSLGTTEINLRAKCAVGKITWDWSVPGCTFADGTTAWQTSNQGLNNTDVRFYKAPGNGPSLTRICYDQVSCVRFRDFGSGSCRSLSDVKYFNAAGTNIGGNSCACSFGGTCASCAAVSCSCCTAFAPSCPECGYDISSCADSDASIPQLSVSGGDPVGFAYQLGFSGYEFEGGFLDDVLTAEEQEENKSNGCCVCPVADRSILSLTDEGGNSWSIVVRIQNEDPDFPLTLPLTV